MNDTTIFPQLEIPETLAAGPGPGNTDPRVLARFAQTGLADHMQSDVLRGMVECKEMLRQVWGTANTYTYGVGGTGFSGLDCMLGAILPGDTVVAFVNGTFSGIDGLTIRMKAATREELRANALDPEAASVTIVTVPHGQSVTGEIVEKALSRAQTEMGLHGALGNRLGPDQRSAGLLGCLRASRRDGAGRCGLIPRDRAIFPSTPIPAWSAGPPARRRASCCLPLTYAPVSASPTAYIAHVCVDNGCASYCPQSDPRSPPLGHHRRQGRGEKGAYHRTHSAYAVAAFHEALRITLQHGRARNVPATMRSTKRRFAMPWSWRWAAPSPRT